MKVCKRCGECIANIVCGIGIPPGASECETFTALAEALKPSHNSAMLKLLLIVRDHVAHTHQHISNESLRRDVERVDAVIAQLSA